jgi:FAD:protein FMN transferase
MSVVASPVLCRRAAMNTWFEIILLGDDAENLHAAGEAALDEIERVEKLLSRFDPASEISRINRDAPKSAVLVDLETATVLETCRNAWQQTRGFFDVAVNRENTSGFSDIEFDFDTRLITFRNADAGLDFGGFGKGYALDCAADCLRAFGVKKALLHGGTSSVLALGNDGDENPWRIGLRNPWNKCEELEHVQLSEEALSTSATGQGVSDILHPHFHKPLQIQAACTVIAKTAAQAEIFSTAFLCMGKKTTISFLPQKADVSFKVLWTSDSASPSTVQL